VFVKIAEVSLLLVGFALVFGGNSRVVIKVVDSTTGKITPCQIYLKDQAGNAVRTQSLPFWHDHFVSPGYAELELSPRRYTYEIERGPEYYIQTGSFLIRDGAVTIWH
jgi:hypothetical protein